jgi:hypothetical protein
MKDAQKPDHLSLIALLERLKDGRFVIPDFQREFEWQPSDVRDLLRSIFLDYYIGGLLLWKGKPETFKALACEDIYGFSDKGHPEHIVLDGQQRLTALYYTLVAPDVPLPNRASRYVFSIRVDQFLEEAYDEAFQYDWTASSLKLLNDVDEQYQRHLFPLSVIGKGGWELPIWFQGYEKYWQLRADEARSDSDSASAASASRHIEGARAFGEHVKGITEQYQIAFVELDRDLELAKVCDIFTQVNSKGIRLDVFDLMNALLKPKGLQLKLMWRTAAPRLDFIEPGRMNVHLLQVMSILRQAYCSPKYLYYLLPGQTKSVRESDGSLRSEVLIPDVEAFEQLWERAVSAMTEAIALLRHPQEFGVIAPQYLPYVSILPVFAALQVEARAVDPSRRLDAQRKVRHWYWASVFTSRYSGAVESTAARDYLDVRQWFADDTSEPALLDEFKSRFRAMDLRKEVRRGTSVYNGVFNLLVLNGARDWLTGNVPQYGDLDDHHIVPKDWGGQEPEVGPLIDTVLNRTPLSGETNRHVISNRLPNEYLPRLIRENGEAVVQGTLESHFISASAFDMLLRDPFTPSDFEAFITERQKTIQDAIESLLIKARLDLSPALRELDSKIEVVELGLRHLLATTLQGDPTRLPSHVIQKVKERLETRSRKDPTMARHSDHSIELQLEYCDLRELEDIITNKSLWSEFEGLFATKELVSAKFAQLGELRNAIRHSRTVDEVTRKEGEAAILWFDRVLAD